MKTNLIFKSILFVIAMYNGGVLAQKSEFFYNFRLISTNATFREGTTDIKKDSILLLKYNLVNNKGDSLLLYRNLRFRWEKDQIVYVVPGVNGMHGLIGLQEDSCYTFCFDTASSRYQAEANKWYNLSFIFKSGNSILMQTDAVNRLVFSFATKEYCSYPPRRNTWNNALDTLLQLAASPTRHSLKKAVFCVENAYVNNAMSFSEFDKKIKAHAAVVSDWSAFNKLQSYHFHDSNQVNLNLSIFHYIKDTTIILTKDDTLQHLPYKYDFKDFNGQKKWTNMFVTKLLAQRKGNCHSMPYLYKILANELNIPCWLSLAPNHMYIKCQNQKNGWFNIELTSGTFPTDAWIMGSGYIPNEAIISGIYMDTLSQQQEIALCLLDLAKGYEHKTNCYTDGFILKCCDSSLAYYPNNIQAILLKAETLRRNYTNLSDKQSAYAKENYSTLENLYGQMITYGYREMPEKMYMNWLGTAQKESRSYE